MTITTVTDRTERITPPCILDASFEYHHSTKTDVTRTWRRFGWVPPDRNRQHQIALALNRNLNHEKADYR